VVNIMHFQQPFLQSSVSHEPF